MLIALSVVISNGYFLLNIGLIFAIFSLFGIFFFKQSFKQLVNYLQICLWTSFTVCVRIALLVFLVESSEFINFRNVIATYKIKIK